MGALLTTTKNNTAPSTAGTIDSCSILIHSTPDLLIAGKRLSQEQNKRGSAVLAIEPSCCLLEKAYFSVQDLLKHRTHNLLPSSRSLCPCNNQQQSQEDSLLTASCSNFMGRDKDHHQQHPDPLSVEEEVCLFRQCSAGLKAIQLSPNMSSTSMSSTSASSSCLTSTPTSRHGGTRACCAAAALPSKTSYSPIVNLRNPIASPRRHSRPSLKSEDSLSGASDQFLEAPNSNRNVQQDERSPVKRRIRQLQKPASVMSQFVKKSVSCYTLKMEAVQSRMLSRSNKVVPSESDHSGMVLLREPPHRRMTTIHASTSDLLKSLGHFYANRLANWNNTSVRSCASRGSSLIRISPVTVIAWIRGVDRALIHQGWAEVAFISPANIAFLYMLLRDYTSAEHIRSERDLQGITLTCLYLAYAYMGNEISYPLRPFLYSSALEERDLFWRRCLTIMNEKSHEMLRFNSEPAFYTKIFTELKSYSDR